MPSYEVICRRCEVSLVTSATEADHYTCPVCGIGTNREVVLKIVGKTFLNPLLKDFQKNMARTLGKSRHVRYVPGNIPEPFHKDFRVERAPDPDDGG